MKPNELKLRLIKIDGINIFYGKGIYNTETTLCTEKKGFFGKNKSYYAITTEHIKRGKKGKGYCIIDLNQHTSIGEIVTKSEGKSIDLNSEKNVKIINQIQYVTQRANWEARVRKMKMSIWSQLILIFCGMGILFFITSMLQSIGVMF